VPATRPAAQADVCPQPIDEPRVAATRVCPTETDDVSEQQVEDGAVRHGGRVSEARVAMARDELPIRGRHSDAIERRHLDADLGLGGR
jgi:hypothetical protein